MRPAWSTFVDSINAEFSQDWIDVHRRLHSEDTAEEQWAGFLAQMGRRVERARESARRQWMKVTAVIERGATLGRRRAESLIRIGQTAVGVLDKAEHSRYQTIDALSNVSALQRELPLIYRRLFSFEPLDEVSLLEGRSRDLVSIKQHYERWKTARQLGVLIIQAPIGSGRTSFLTALAATVFEDGDVIHLSLKERLYHPDEFAALVAPALGIMKKDITLDDLEQTLSHTRRPDPPRVCLIDNLEHLVLRPLRA